MDCSGRTCISCDAVWHDGETCEAFTTRRREEDARNEENMASCQYVEKETKKCPGCGAPTEKNHGCDHMTCKQYTEYFRKEPDYGLTLSQVAVANISTAGYALRTTYPSSERAIVTIAKTANITPAISLPYLRPRLYCVSHFWPGWVVVLLALWAKRVPCPEMGYAPRPLQPEQSMGQHHSDFGAPDLIWCHVAGCSVS